MDNKEKTDRRFSIRKSPRSTSDISGSTNKKEDSQPNLFIKPVLSSSNSNPICLVNEELKTRVHSLKKTSGAPSPAPRPRRESLGASQENVFRSVRKLTLCPIAETNEGSIRILPLQGTDKVRWSKFEEQFSVAGRDEPEELKPLFDLHNYDFEVISRRRRVDAKQFLVSKSIIIFFF